MDGSIAHPRSILLSRRRSVQRQTCNSHRRSRVNGHGRTVVTPTGPPVGLTGGNPKLSTLVPDLSPTPCTPCAPSRWILAASTQPRAPGETRPIWGASGAPKVPRHFPRTAHQPPATAPLWTGRSTANRLRYGGPRTRNDCVSARTGPGPSDQLSDNRARDTRMTVDSETPFTCSDDKQDRSQDCFGTKRRPAAC